MRDKVLGFRYFFILNRELLDKYNAPKYYPMD